MSNSNGNRYICNYVYFGYSCADPEVFGFPDKFPKCRKTKMLQDNFKSFLLAWAAYVIFYFFLNKQKILISDSRDSWMDLKWETWLCFQISWLGFFPLRNLTLQHDAVIWEEVENHLDLLISPHAWLTALGSLQKPLLLLQFNDDHSVPFARSCAMLFRDAEDTNLGAIHTWLETEAPHRNINGPWPTTGCSCGR